MKFYINVGSSKEQPTIERILLLFDDSFCVHSTCLSTQLH